MTSRPGALTRFGLPRASAKGDGWGARSTSWVPLPFRLRTDSESELEPVAKRWPIPGS
jgi:hypothetical protein